MENQYSDKYRHLYSALVRGDYTHAKNLLNCEEQSFVQFMDTYISEHGLIRQAILLRADIPVAVGYKYLSGAKRTKNRNTILRLCIAMEMPVDDVQKVLRLYGMNSLGENSRDSVIRVGIEHRSTVDDIDEWLRAMSMEPLMDSYDR